MSPLLQAVSRHDTAMATLLLDHGADPNQPKKDGVTPVFLATVFPPKDARDLSLATLLVERGADVTRPGESRQTALEWVAFYGHVPIADFLVRHGADVNAVAPLWADTAIYGRATAPRRHDCISYRSWSNEAIDFRLTKRSY
jgi:ankyrin repeat protein